MSALPNLASTNAPIPDVSQETRALINRLRFHAARCRASSRLDIFEACHLMEATGDRDIATATLIRVASQALDHAPRWLRPGEPELTFDELWFAQVIQSLAVGDLDSFAFLTRSRIARNKRRMFGALAARVAKQAS